MPDSTTVSAAYALTLSPTEQVGNSPATPTGTSGTVVHSGFNKSGTLTSATTPPATKVAAFDVAMTDGSGEIDFRALVGTNAGAVDGNGLKLQLLLINSRPRTRTRLKSLRARRTALRL